MILAAKARLEQDPDMRKLGHVSIYYLFHISKNGEQAVSRVREWAGKKPPDQNGNGKTEWLKFRDYDIRCECEKGGICGYKRNIDDRAETVIRCDQCGKIYAAEALKKLRATA
jgi:ribosomal protein S27E